MVAAICVLLALAVVLVFFQTRGHDFVNFDDDQYVYDKEHVNRGLTWHGLWYYACHRHAYTYHPLTTFSHMLDCQLFGLEAGGHHAMNVALHAITAVLLFLLLRRMTGRLWPSAVAAALFAVHPLRVESVAWISERKDVLSGLFFVLTLGAYVRYARAAPAAGRYLTVCAAVRLGAVGQADARHLAGGPAAVGLLAVAAPGGFLRLFAEKIPLLLLSLADSALTVCTQVAAIRSMETVSWPSRGANALAACESYLGCFFWPQGLAVLYPHPGNAFSRERLAATVSAAVVLMLITGGLVLLRRRAPCLLVGWLWCLVMLLPVIGIIQVGGQKMADRYTYLPQIGLVLGLVWAAAGLADFIAVRAGTA